MIEKIDRTCGRKTDDPAVGLGPTVRDGVDRTRAGPCSISGEDGDVPGDRWVGNGQVVGHCGRGGRDRAHPVGAPYLTDPRLTRVEACATHPAPPAPSATAIAAPIAAQRERYMTELPRCSNISVPFLPGLRRWKPERKLIVKPNLFLPTHTRELRLLQGRLHPDLPLRA